MTSEITYSPAYTIVPTYECFNRCSYCNFRVDLGQGTSLSLTDTEARLRSLDQSIIEILILSGEVHLHSQERQSWFTKILKICELSLELGFLPHTNVGPLSWSEMSQLKQVNVSMGLMLEQLNDKFMQTVHQHAPSKKPEVRLQQLEWAGKLKIPFTTGLLLGIGETDLDIQESLEAIAKKHKAWGHIQEVILQPHSIGSSQALNIPSFDPSRLPKIIALARQILPKDISIQIPPNLVPEASFLLECLAAGATDLGGIGPKDEVNANYPHPTPQSLSEILRGSRWSLKPRLPVYPQHYDWLPSRLKKATLTANKALISQKIVF